jgi:hypothetical protein
MKTTILNLEADDDIISCRDKMQWSNADRILLVYPRQANILYRRIDLVLLKRQSEALGAQLAIVSRHPEVRYLAPRLGIPVFKRLENAQKSHWRLPRRFRDSENDLSLSDNILERVKPSKKYRIRDLFTQRPDRTPKFDHPIVRLFFFLIGVLAFLSIAASLYPRAEIQIKPERRIHTVNIEIIADPNIETMNIMGIVPAHQIEIVVEGRDDLPVSGSLQLPDQPAIGYVRFTNLSDETVTISEGTIVRIQDETAYRYRVTESGILPAIPGTTLDLPIKALSPGKLFNVPPESINAIEGHLGTQLSVTNLYPVQHGSDRIEPAPADKDRAELFGQLKSTLEDTAIREIQSSLEKDDFLIIPSLRLLEVIEEKYQPEQNQPADRLNLSLQLKFSAQVAYGQDLKQLVEQSLAASIPPGYSPIDNSIDFKNLGTPDILENGNASWKIRATQDIEATIKEDFAIQRIIGLKPEDAQHTLMQDYVLSDTPQIILSPDWWRRLPILPFNIMITNINDNVIFND